MAIKRNISLNIKHLEEKNVFFSRGMIFYNFFNLEGKKNKHTLNENYFQLHNFSKAINTAMQRRKVSRVAKKIVKSWRRKIKSRHTSKCVKFTSQSFFLFSGISFRPEECSDRKFIALLSLSPIKLFPESSSGIYLFASLCLMKLA